MKLKPEDLKKISQRMRAATILREGSSRARITVHMGTCGIASGAREILNAFMELKEDQAAEDVILTTSGCAGLCAREPMATVEVSGQAPVKYVDLTAAKTARIFQEHVQNGRAVAEYALVEGCERIS